jgi:hypothetical protein
MLLSSEWFSRPADEWYASLSELFAGLRPRRAQAAVEHGKRGKVGTEIVNETSSRSVDAATVLRAIGSTRKFHRKIYRTR